MPKDSDKQNELGEILASALFFYGSLLLFFLITAIGLLILLTRGTISSEDQTWAVKLALIIMIGDALLALIGGTLAAILKGFQFFFTSNATLIVSKLIHAVVLFFLLKNDYGIVSIAILTFSLNFILYCCHYYIVFHYQKVIQWSWLSWNAQQCKTMIIFGSKNLLVILVNKIQLQSPPLFLGNIASPSLVPYYNIPDKLVGYLRLFLWQGTQAFLPAFSSLYDSNNPNDPKLSSAYQQFSRLFALLTFPVISVVILFGKNFIGVWIGPEVLDSTAGVIELLAIALLANCCTPLLGRLSTAKGNQMILFKVRIVSVVGFLIAAPIAIYYQGTQGAAFAFMVSSIINALLDIVVCHQHMGIKWQKYMLAVC